MANKNRNKGIYHEKEIVKWLTSLNFKAKKQPLSGSLGGEYRGDILWTIGERELVAEVKYRDKSNFPNPFTLFDERDVVIFKRRNGSPKMIVMFEADLFASDIAPILTGEVNEKKST